jgi:hypothetical protein
MGLIAIILILMLIFAPELLVLVGVGIVALILGFFEMLGRIFGKKD